MRTIVNFSMPPLMAETLKKRAKKRGFATASEYIRFLLNLDTDLISPDKLLEMSKQADKEYGAGKLKNGGLSKFMT